MILAALVVLVVLLERIGRLPAKYRDLDTGRIRSLVDLLYVRGLDLAFLQFDVRGQVPTFRVYKRILRQDDVRFILWVPDSTFRMVGEHEYRAFLRSFGCSETPNSLDGEATGVCALCGSNRPHMVAVIEGFLKEMLKASPEQDAVAYIRKAHPNVRVHPGLAEPPEGSV